MNLLRTGLSQSLTEALVLILACSQGMAGVSTGERLWESPSMWEGGGSLAVGYHGVPECHDPTQPNGTGIRPCVARNGESMMRSSVAWNT